MGANEAVCGARLPGNTNVWQIKAESEIKQGAISSQACFTEGSEVQGIKVEVETTASLPT